jgi:hypothetical protein
LHRKIGVGSAAGLARSELRLACIAANRAHLIAIQRVGIVAALPAIVPARLSLDTIP